MSTREAWEKIELYIVSLWFLFFLIIVVTIEIPTYIGSDWTFIGIGNIVKMNLIPLISFLFVIAGMVFYSRFKYKVSGSKKLAVKITNIRDVNYEHLIFLTTYIIPLVGFNLTNTRYALTLGILLVVIGVIYIKTDKFYANPTLAVLGYHIYKTDISTRTGNRSDIILITREKLHIDDLVNYKRLDDKVFFARKVA